MYNQEIPEDDEREGATEDLLTVEDLLEIYALKPSDTIQTLLDEIQKSINEGE